jgi:hypothetical protein
VNFFQEYWANDTKLIHCGFPRDGPVQFLCILPEDRGSMFLRNMPIPSKRRFLTLTIFAFSHEYL